jgi:hypothetical protein
LSSSATYSFTIPFPKARLVHCSVDCGTVGTSGSIDVQYGGTTILDAAFTLTSSTPASDFVTKGTQLSAGNQVDVVFTTGGSIANPLCVMTFAVGGGDKLPIKGDKV